MKTLKNLLVSILLVLGLFACKTQKPDVQTQTVSVATDKPQSVYVNGEKLHYIKQGSGEPLIFIHGTVGDYRVWIPRVEEYSQNFEVIAYSRRYAYPNKKVFDQTADYSPRIHADDLYALIQKLGLKKVNLVGHSYGAFTALTMALDHPELVKSLVLGEPPASSLLENSSSGKASFNQFREHYIEPAGKAFSTGENEKGVESFLKGVMGDDFSINQVPSEVKQRWMDNLPEVWAVSTVNWVRPLEISKIKELKVPVLLLMGDQSPAWFGEIANALHRSLPQSELVTIENSSHGLYFENPEACDTAIKEFLNRN
ncbi:MAG: alpha/beta hydrolase [Algicola sp.]|nr:alpha/beta hydrolase [Algicola sp.]